jgi:hypothetical protein
MIRLKTKNGSANNRDAASHFHMKKYNCVIVTSVKAFLAETGGAGGGTGPVTMVAGTGAVFAKSSILDINAIVFLSVFCVQHFITLLLSLKDPAWLYFGKDFADLLICPNLR